MKDPATESVKGHVRRWRSIRILYLTMFVDSLAFSIVLSSIWPFLLKIDATASPTLVGWANVGFQLAGILMDFGMGFWMNVRGSTEPMLAGLLFFGAGNLCYAYSQAAGSFGSAMVVLSRTIIGLSSGVNVVTRAVAAEATTLKERTVVLAHMSIAQGAGFSFGPVIQTAVNPIGDVGYYLPMFKLHVNLYTAPALISIVLAIVNALVIICYYSEHGVDIYADNDSDHDVITYKKLLRKRSSSFSSHREDVIALGSILLLYFVVQNVFALHETIVTPLAMEQFAWTRQQTALWIGIVFLVAGIIAVAVFASTGFLAQRFSERRTLVVGLLFMLGGFIVYLPWGSEYPVLKGLADRNSSTSYTTHRIYKADVGCPMEYSWCFSTPRLYLWQLIVAMTCLSIGYPIGLVLTGSIYSKILGANSKGLMMSYLAATGGIARIVGPTMVTQMYVASGPRWTFVTIIGLVLMSVIFLAVSWRRLIPYHVFILQKVKNRASYISSTSSDYVSCPSSVEVKLVENFLVQECVTVV